MLTFAKVQKPCSILQNNAVQKLIAVFIALIFLLVGIAYFSDNKINWLGLSIIIFFYAIIFGIGIWSSYKKKSNQSDDFLLAGRKLPLWIAMLTMAATWIGGGYINGTAEAAAVSGLVWVQAPWGYGLSLIIGGLFFAPKMRRLQFKTMLDPLAQRFGDRATGLFFLPAVLGEIFWVAAILTALGTTFAVIIGLDAQTSIIISAIIAILYTSVGGLWSVAYTDVFQLALLVLGLLLVLPFLLSSVGGVSEMWSSYKGQFGSNAFLIPSYLGMGNYFWNWLDFGLLLVFGGIPWQVYFQRVLAAKNENTARWLSIFAGVICILIAIPSAMIGMVGAVTDWSALSLNGPENAASTLPYVFHHLSPKYIAILGLGAIAAAVMSSIDSSMLSASTLAAWNVYKPLVKPDISSVGLKKILRRSIIIVGLLATYLSLKLESVYALWFLCSDFVYCLLFPALVTAMFDSKANRIGAIAGFAIAAILRIGGGDATLGLPILFPYPMIEDGVVLFPFRTSAMICGLITIIVVSRITQHIVPASPLRASIEAK